MWLKNFVNFALFIYIVVLLNACSSAAEDVEVVDEKVPQTVNAQSKESEVVVTWRPVPDAERYIVCWAYVPITDCDPANPKIVRIDPDPAITEPRWTHSGITNSTVYYYVVIAVSSTWGESALSTNVSGVPEGVAPPTLISISTFDLNATVGWDPVANADSYRVHMATEPGVKVGNPNNLSGYKSYEISASNIAHIKYTVSGLVEGTAYHFVVTALRDYGDGTILETLESQEVIAIPKAMLDSQSGYMPTDFTVKSGFVNISGDQKVNEYYDLAMSNPCTAQNGNIVSIHWSESPFVDLPPNCANDGSCKGDITIGDTISPLNTNTVKEGVLYYFTVKNFVSNPCGTSPVPSADFRTGNIAARTPGVIFPTKPVFTAIPSANFENAVTVTIDQPVSGLTYNLYMATKKYFDTVADEFSVDTYTLDVDWGMKHSNIPAVFYHRALPSNLAFYFVVTAVNTHGDESVASEVILVNPSAPAAP